MMHSSGGTTSVHALEEEGVALLVLMLCMIVARYCCSQHVKQQPHVKQIQYMRPGCMIDSFVSYPQWLQGDCRVFQAHLCMSVGVFLDLVQALSPMIKDSYCGLT